MDDLLLGLQLTAVGMGTVFLLLAALMGLLVLLGRLDRPDADRPLTSGRTGRAGDTAVAGGRAALADQDAPTGRDAPAGGGAPGETGVRVHAHGLDDDTLAAITAAVLTHVRLRRRQAAPETRAVPPGAQLRTSRWVALGRAASATSSVSPPTPRTPPNPRPATTPPTPTTRS